MYAYSLTAVDIQKVSRCPMSSSGSGSRSGTPDSFGIIDDRCVCALCALALPRWRLILCLPHAPCPSGDDSDIPIILGYDCSLHEYEVRATAKVAALLSALDDKVRWALRSPAAVPH